MPSVLIVDDEQPIREMVSFALRRAGFEPLQAGDAREAEALIADHAPDLILLDWMLPDVSGVDLARRLRGDELTREIPIIMLTARTGENEKIQGLNSGADDYVTKPFSPRELVARVQAVLRRTSPQAAGEMLQAGDLELDPVSHRVTAGNTPVRLGPTEFKLLRFFMAHPERVYSRSQLLDLVWGRNVYIEERTVDVHIRRLRMALGPGRLDEMIQTVRGVGYRFSSQV
jgi:two-component system phosphate regulon response regulator PhoB